MKLLIYSAGLLLTSLRPVTLAQAQFPLLRSAAPAGRSVIPPISTWHPEPSGVSRSRVGQNTAPPSVPLMPMTDATGLIPTESDSASRRVFARHRVRTVVKVRLNKQGQVRDTVEYQEIDPRGHRTLQWRRGPAGLDRQQWSYDTTDNCTSRIIYPLAQRTFTTIYTFNPAIGRSRCELLQPNGKRTSVYEAQRQQLGDTLLTEAKFTTGYRRVLRYHAAPDTVIILANFYSLDERLLASQLQYELWHNRQPYETGRVDILRARRLYQRGTAQKSMARPFLAVWVPRLLRSDIRTRQPLAYFEYDGRGRLTQRRLVLAGQRPRPRRHTSAADAGPSLATVNTYNELDQLIGQQHHPKGLRTSAYTGYTVFSYHPNGLLAGETDRRDTTRPTFYRYLYQYYD